MQLILVPCPELYLVPWTLPGVTPEHSQVWHWNKTQTNKDVLVEINVDGFSEGFVSRQYQIYKWVWHWLLNVYWSKILYSESLADCFQILQYLKKYYNKPLFTLNWFEYVALYFELQSWVHSYQGKIAFRVCSEICLILIHNQIHSQYEVYWFFPLSELYRSLR